MALPSSIQAILARFRGSNNNAYNATTNPLGLGQGGHRQNFGPRLKDTADVVDWMASSVDAIYADATTASNAAGTATTAAAAAGSARDKANLWANAPEDQEVETGKFSAFHFMRKAMAQVGLASDQVTLATNQAQRLQGTSTTSQTPSVASKTFTTQSGKAFDVGNSLLVQSRGNIDRWMSGRVTAYSGTSVTIAVEAIGTVTSAATDWDLRVIGVRGAQGIQGIPGIATMPYSGRSSNTTLVAGDSASLIDLTGSFTQAFSAAATLGANWYAFVRNNGTGDITLKPNGSETIDGLASFISYPGEVRLIQCDGTALRSIVVEPGTKTFTSSDNLIWPPGVNGAHVEAVGGGGGGGRPNSTQSGASAGGGGGYNVTTIGPQTPGESISASVGAGGLGGTTSGANGTAGGASSLGGSVVAQGGQAGGSNNNSGGNGGAASALSYVMSGFALGFAGGSQNTSSDRGGGGGGAGGAGGNSAFGGGGGGGGGSGSAGIAGGSSGGVAGGAGGAFNNTGAGGAGGPGASDTKGNLRGSGGGGGGHGGASVGGAGGAGGFPGGGGGGGGTSNNSSACGNGGNGGAGRIIVRFF